MCFAPQRRALFQHLNFQKWSGAEVFCTFWLGNVLRATTACTFLTSQLPKVVRDRQFLTLLTSKCASRHNGVQFFIAPVASWLRTRRFSEPTFRPPGATNHWKNTVFRDFPTFSRICIFCLLTLSLLIFSLLIFLFSLPLPCSAFHLSILSEVWLLNFLRIVFFARCQVGDATMSSRCALNTSKLKHHDSATHKRCPFCAHTNTMIHEGESLWSRTSWIYVCSSWIGHADFRLEHLCFPVESLKELDVYRNHWGLSLQSATGSVIFHEP